MLIKTKKSRSTILSIIFLLFCVLSMLVTNGCSWDKNNIPITNISSYGKLSLSWDEVPNVNFYNIYFSNVPGLTKTNSNKIPNAGNPIKIVDLKPNATYYFVITAVDDFGERAISKEISYRVGEAEGLLKVENLFSPQNLIIFFSTNSTELSNSEIEKLNQFAKYIIGISRYHVRLDGYADSAGDSVYNKLISKNRADIVKSYLVSRGIRAKNIDAMGHGAKKFIADNSTPEGRGMNRRVEIDFQIFY